MIAVVKENIGRTNVSKQLGKKRLGSAEVQLVLVTEVLGDHPAWDLTRRQQGIALGKDASIGRWHVNRI